MATSKPENIDRLTKALFRISKALHQFRTLNQRLEFITKEVQELINVEGASVILLNQEKNEFFFPVTAYDDTETSRKMREIRFPATKGVAGHVYKTGKPLIVPDTSESEFFFKKVDQQARYKTSNMLDVPIQIQDRMIGVLCAVNKKKGIFDQRDIEIASAIANIVALPIENARINDQLKSSYQEVKSLNQAKDRVIHHLSHELKTPVSVLDASLELLKRRLSDHQNQSIQKIFNRAERNLNRILEMQYRVEDIMRQKNTISV
jgi:GAF domain-containing protein